MEYESQDKMIREIQLTTSEQYDPENFYPFCCYTFWKRCIYPVYKCSYKIYTQYLKVKFPDVDYPLPTPRHYEAETIRKIRAINEYMKLHYRPGNRPKITIKSVWKEFVKSHFVIDYSGFRVYSLMDADQIEDAQTD